MTSSKRHDPVSVCLDTNVWISAVIRGGNPARIVEMAELGAVRIFISPAILEEIDRVLHYRKITVLLHGAELSAASIMDKIVSLSHIVEPKEKLGVIQDDESDNRILECAAAATVDFIVSGDKHLLKLSEFNRISIVDPASFLELLSSD